MPEGLPIDESADELYEHAPCGYLTLDAEGRTSRVNATFLAWTGLDRDAVVGRPFTDLLTAGGRLFHETHVAPLLRLQGLAREVALDVACPAGTLPVLLNAAARRDADGGLREVRMVLLDARERRSYERELLRARRRAERLARLGEALLASRDRDAIGRAALAELGPLVGARAAALVDGGGRTTWQEGDVPPAGGGERVVRLPLQGPGGDHGALVLVRTGGAPVEDADAALLVAGAQQCTQALERLLLQEATAAAAERAALLARLGRELSELRTLADRAERLVELLAVGLADAVVLDVPADGRSPGVFALAGSPSPEAMQAAAQRAPRLEDDLAALPLHGRGRPLGTLVLARRHGRPWRPGDREHLDDVAARAGLALDNARLAEHERTIAHELQRSLLAGEPPRDARLRIATHYRPAVEGLDVGGDWHDAFPVAGDRVAVVVGDVVGRGLQAATAMGQLRSAVRALAAAGLPPAQLLERLDRFVEHQPPTRNATLAYVELDLATGEARLACAGHPPPVLVRRSSAELVWGGRSAPLGAYHGTSDRAEAGLTLTPGDRLLLYTDGLVERRGLDLAERLGELAAAAHAHREAPPGRFVHRVTEALLPEPPDDDVCLLALAYGAGGRQARRDGPEGSAALRAGVPAAPGVDPQDGPAVVLAGAKAA